MNDMILILNYSDEFAVEAAKRLRGERVFCKIISGTTTAAQVAEIAPRGLVLCGEPKSAAGVFDAEILKLDIPVLALVENMSGFVCPDCGAVHNIFKSGGGAKLAAERSISFLGKLPIDPQVVDSEDIGNPTAAMSPKTKEALETIVNNIIEKVK